MEEPFGTVIKDREGRRVVEVSQGSDGNFNPVIFLEFDNGQALFFYPAKAREFAKELIAVADNCKRGSQTPRSGNPRRPQAQGTLTERD